MLHAFPCRGFARNVRKEDRLVNVTVEKVRRQAGFVGETARRIAREPALGRELPRLLATGGRSTMRLRLPWLPFRLIDELEAVIRPGSRVFEYGGGGSTLWFLDRGAVVVTVEHHPEWAALLGRSIDSGNWTLLERSVAPSVARGYASYADAISTYPDEWFDVVVVDGRARRRCVARALPKIKPSGLLLVDDVNREKYADAVGNVGWPRMDVVGLAPAKLSLGHTAVLTRPRA
jgi:Methyltransferase domain